MKNTAPADKPEGFGRLPTSFCSTAAKGHVGAIRPLLREMGIDVPVYGMVKDDKHRTRAITEDGGEIAIQSTRAVFTLVSSIQDEVHRFAIGYHRQQLQKRRPSPPRSRPFRASAKRAPKR